MDDRRLAVPVLTLLMFLTSCVSLGFALRTRLFPGYSAVAGQSLPSAVLLILIGWVSLHTLAVSLIAGSATSLPPRRVYERVALCFCLIVPCGAALCLLPATARLMHQQYLGKLLLAAIFGLLCRLLLPLEFRAALDRLERVWKSPRGGFVLRLGTCSICLVGLSEEVGLAVAGVRVLDFPPLRPWPLLVNGALLGCVIGALAALTKRLGLSALSAGAIVVILGAANGMKIRYLRVPLQPMDGQYVSEFLPYFMRFFRATIPAMLVALGALTAGIVVALRRPPTDLGPRSRASLGLALVFVGCVVNSASSPRIRESWRSTGIVLDYWNSVLSSRANGLLLELALNWSLTRLAPPERYSNEEIQRTAERYNKGLGEDTGTTVRTNLVVFVFESLMDPEDLGVTLSQDPIPNLRRLGRQGTSGYSFVYGGSANSEFELLTGMSMGFLPPGSCPYKQYVHQDVPSLPRLLRQNGYRAVALHLCGPPAWNRPQVYPHLGIEAVRWLGEEPPLLKGLGDHSDDFLVTAILDALVGKPPAFVFAFNVSTHSPYLPEAETTEPRIRVAQALPAAAKGEVEAYLARVSDVDRAIGTLARALEESSQPTLLLVVGDHQPALAHGQDLARFERGLDSGASGKRHRVPFILWSNSQGPRETVSLGMNSIASFLAERMHLRRDGYWALADTVRRNAPPTVASPVGSVVAASILEDYRLIQYDLLLGHQYALQTWSH